MNATNNLALMQIGPAVADHDSQAMNEPATKQDLYNMGVQIDSNFGKVISQFELVNKQFEIVDGQFTNLRTDMNAGFSNLRTDMDAKFDRAQVALNKTLFKFGSLYFTMMFAVLSVERWWR
jgi:hypothetical protein